ncbi:MAG TPA: glycosyltransferase family 2 protein [Terracidiphilus sp.]|nr:glycosyltransferase family 2 protein [Terracidiphilus sp.]
MSSGYLQTRPNPGLLSIVAPCYNEEQSLPLLAAEITRFINASPYPCEVILVNDGSTDRTIDFLVGWSSRDRRIKVLSFSRNFGHQVAATAGVDHATGDAVVLIDADLQDPLDVIHQMVAEYRNGYDVVCGQRSIRKGENFFKRATAWFFYRVMRSFFLESLPADVGDFRLMSRQCVETLRSMRELHRFLRGMVAWVGYPQICVRYERQPRVAGQTKYPLSKMLRLAWNAAVSFSPLPLRMSFYAGALMALLAIEEAIRALVAYHSGSTVPGWTSLMIVLCVSNAALLITVGILGEYVGRIFEESKGRPLYIVAGSWNFTPGNASGSATPGPSAAAREETSTTPQAR